MFIGLGHSFSAMKEQVTDLYRMVLDHVVVKLCHAKLVRCFTQKGVTVD